MRYLFFLWIILGSMLLNELYAQNENIYKINRHESVYIPLGKVSFADSIVGFNVGSPVPFKKYSDSSQALNAPNYITYDIPNYVSLGCKGNLTVAFTDNGLALSIGIRGAEGKRNSMPIFNLMWHLERQAQRG
jgi:hypothetical protein